MKKRSFIDSVRVKDPCTKSWDEMTGNDKVRFCTHCAKDVSNLSAMTRKEALKLVRRSGGSLCIRYVQQPVTKAPMFAEQLTQITRRRAPLMAAGVMSATLSLASLTYAQGGAAVTGRIARSPTTVSECEDVGHDATKKDGAAKKEGAVKTSSAIKTSDALLSGTILDPYGAVIPNVEIEVKDASGRIIRRARSTDEGSFRFDRLAAGTYTLTASANNFVSSSEDVAVDGDQTSVDISLQVVGTTSIAGDMVIKPEFEGALAQAVAIDNIALARELIAKGDDVNRKEDDGGTPLFIAVENGNLEMVELLLNSGAKVNIRNKARETALMQLDEDAPVAMVELLLSYGAKVNQLAKNGDTALIRAAASVQPDVLRALVNAGASLDAQNDKGITALMNAAEEDEIENTQILVLAGANVNLKDIEGETAWDKTTDKAIEEFLESWGATTDEPETEDN